MSEETKEETKNFVEEQNLGSNVEKAEYYAPGRKCKGLGSILVDLLVKENEEENEEENKEENEEENKEENEEENKEENEEENKAGCNNLDDPQLLAFNKLLGIGSILVDLLVKENKEESEEESEEESDEEEEEESEVGCCNNLDDPQWLAFNNLLLTHDKLVDAFLIMISDNE